MRRVPSSCDVNKQHGLASEPSIASAAAFTWCQIISIELMACWQRALQRSPQQPERNQTLKTKTKSPQIFLSNAASGRASTAEARARHDGRT
jgi:hypothetical protein